MKKTRYSDYLCEVEAYLEMLALKRAAKKAADTGCELHKRFSSIFRKRGKCRRR